jgi:hypothetical protein
MKFKTEDSGKREEFKSGMRRDTQEGKIRYDLIYMPMLKRWAELMTRGAEKYGDNNWMKANGQEEMDRFKQSAIRHFFQWWEGDESEDHASAVWFNICGTEYLKTKLRKENEERTKIIQQAQDHVNNVL